MDQLNITPDITNDLGPTKLESHKNFRIEDTFATKPNSCILYEVEHGRSMYETPHPYVFDMNCKNEFICQNSEFIHYRLLKMEVNCLTTETWPFGPYLDYFEIDKKGRVHR